MLIKVVFDVIGADLLGLFIFIEYSMFFFKYVAILPKIIGLRSFRYFPFATQALWFLALQRLSTFPVDNSVGIFIKTLCSPYHYLLYSTLQ